MTRRCLRRHMCPSMNRRQCCEKCHGATQQRNNIIYIIHKAASDTERCSTQGMRPVGVGRGSNPGMGTVGVGRGNQITESLMAAWMDARVTQLRHAASRQALEGYQVYTFNPHTACRQARRIFRTQTGVAGVHACACQSTPPWLAACCCQHTNTPAYWRVDMTPRQGTQRAVEQCACQPTHASVKQLGQGRQEPRRACGL